MPRWLIWTLIGVFGLGFLVCAGCGGMFWFIQHKMNVTGMVKTQIQFTQSIRENDASAGWNIMTPELKKRKTLSQYKHELNSLHAKYGPFQIPQQKIEFNMNNTDKKTDQTYTMSGKKGDVSFTFSMVHNGVDWLIDDIKFKTPGGGSESGNSSQ